MVDETTQAETEAYVRPSDKLLVQKVADEMVLLDLERGLYYGLDAVATRMFELACQLPDAAQVVSQLAEEYDAPPSVLDEDLEALLADMAAAGLILRSTGEGTPE